MNPIDRQMLYEFVNENIGAFHVLRLQALASIDLKKVLTKKNPYLFKAKNLHVAGELVNSMLDALLSSSEEKIFGDFLEQLAIFISEQTCQGRKSSAAGLDLEFDHEGTRHLVAIKSGPNWGNSSQYASLRRNFERAVAVQRQARSGYIIQPVLGICYGKSKTVDNGLYVKVMGQSFWHLISGDPNLYLDIVEPIGFRAREHNDRFMEMKAALENKLVQAFINQFCLPDGHIDWDKLVRFNSGNLT